MQKHSQSELNKRRKQKKNKMKINNKIERREKNSRLNNEWIKKNHTLCNEMWNEKTVKPLQTPQQRIESYIQC